MKAGMKETRARYQQGSTPEVKRAKGSGQRGAYGRGASGAERVRGGLGKALSSGGRTTRVPGLSPIAALNRGEELRLHLRAAANNGVTAEEIREVLLQCTIYCGVRAADAVIHAAKEILSELSQTR